METRGHFWDAYPNSPFFETKSKIGGRKLANKRKTTQKRQTRQTRKMNTETAVIILIVAGLLSGVLIYFKSGYIGEYLTNMLGGIFGTAKYIIPIGIFAIAIYLIRNNKDYVTSKLAQYGIFICCICAILSIYEVSIKKSLIMNQELQSVLERAYYLGTTNRGGGIIGAIIAFPLIKLLGIPGTIILAVGLAVIFAVFIFGFKPTEVINNIVDIGFQGKDPLTDFRGSGLLGLKHLWNFNLIDPRAENVFKVATNQKTWY